MARTIGSFETSVGETRALGIDWTNDLWAGITLSTVSLPSVTGVTVSGAAINVATFANDDGGTVAIGNGCLFTIATPTAGSYTLTVTVTTSNSKTLVFSFSVVVT